MQFLRFGSTGSLVELMQLGLLRAGYNPGEIDGVFGSMTLNALRAFQKDFGLLADGIYGPATERALTPYYLGYVTYTIRRGDTLYGIAAYYGTTIDSILNANPGLSADNLMIGQSIMVPYSFDVVPENVSQSYKLVDFCVRGLKARFPFINLGSIGTSVMGKQLYCIEIGSGSKELFYNASHHANEWITSTLMLKFIEDYAFAVAYNDSIHGYYARDLFKKTKLYIAVMVNPDGVDLVTGALSQASETYQNALAMNAQYKIPFPSGWKANIRGVDLNLQYPAEWERAKEIKFAMGYTSPGPRDYVGTAPLTEPESRSVYDFTLRHDFKITLSYHTQGKVIFWRFLDIEPENAYEIATQFARVSGYTVDDAPPESSFAGYKDWFIQNYDRPGYTIEAGEGENPLPLSQFEEIYKDNIGILIEAMESASLI